MKVAAVSMHNEINTANVFEANSFFSSLVNISKCIGKSCIKLCIDSEYIIYQ